VQCHGAQHKVEGPRLEGQVLLVGDDSRPVRPKRKSESEIGPDEALDARSTSKRCRDFVAVYAEVEGERKAMLYVVKAVDQSVGDLALEEGSPIPGTRGAFASLA
jgi:hypothetical protein